MPESIRKYNRNRRILQWALLSIVVITIALGWRYPWLGFSVPIVMIMGIIGGIFNGRYICGNLCPRGGFFDRVMAPLSPQKSIFEFLRRMTLRWIILAALMGFMIYRLSKNPISWHHWGYTFWVMCVITTSIGVILGLLVHQRMWCSFCPIGTLQSALGGQKNALQIDTEKCVSCHLCEKACPFGLSILRHRESGVVNEPDCLKCSECVIVCPKNALSFPSKQTR
ncbi:4Fe-4S binding protein [Candidatus Sumerlaeota bacterium]|nr:4Fe-4S binding protein [Candidatus Sumerlaeota bacterium]